MKNELMLVIVVLMFLCNSCTTKALWEKTNPNEYVKIEFSEITENELQAKDAHYIKDDNEQAFYVEKSSFAKFKDYSIRILGTPFTVVIDTTAIIIIAAAYGTVDKTIEDARKQACIEDPFCDVEPWD